MKKLLYVLPLLVLGVVTYVLIQNQKPKLLPEQQFAFKDIPSITKITIEDRQNGRVVLTKDKNNNWHVNHKYPARMDFLVILLETIANLKAEFPVQKAALNNVMREMIVTAKEVKIYTSDTTKPEKILFIGAMTMDEKANFAMVKGSNPYTVTIGGKEGNMTSRFTTKENQWRDRTVFRIPKDSISNITTEFPYEPDSSYKLSIINNQFTLTTLNNILITPLNIQKIEQYVQGFKNLIAEGFHYDNTLKDSILLSKPFCKITVKKTNNKEVTMNVYYRDYDKRSKAVVFLNNGDSIDAERFLAGINDNKDLVTIQQYNFGIILRHYNDFLK